MLGLTRRRLLALFGAAAATPVLPEVSASEPAIPPFELPDLRGRTVFDRDRVLMPQMTSWTMPPSFYGDELDVILKESVRLVKWDNVNVNVNVNVNEDA